MKSRLLAAPLIFPMLGIVCAQEGLWQQHITEANLLMGSGRYREARDAYQLTLQDRETSSDDLGTDGRSQ
jgi:hypothetical protein